MYTIQNWSRFKDHDLDCTTFFLPGCSNSLTYEFNYDTSRTPTSVTLTCTDCGTTTLAYTTASGAWLSLSTRVGLTEPVTKRIFLTSKFRRYRRY